MNEKTEKLDLVKDILNDEPVFPRPEIQGYKNNLMIKTETPTRDESLQTEKRICHTSRKIRVN